MNLNISVPQDLKDIPITSTKDKKLNKLVNGETKLLKSKKNQRLEDTNYIIHRGHIRNKDSNFGNTLKIIKVYDDVMNKSRFISRGTSSGYNNDFLSNTVRLNNSNSHTFENRKKAALFQEIRKDPTMKNMLRKAGFVNLIKDINQYAFKYTTKRVLDCKQLKFSKNQEIHKETLETPTSPKFIKLKIPELIRKESFRPKEIHKKIHKSPRIKLRIPNFDEALRSPEKFILSNLDTSTPNLAIEKKPTILTRSGGAQSARHMSRINSKMCNW